MLRRIGLRAPREKIVEHLGVATVRFAQTLHDVRGELCALAKPVTFAARLALGYRLRLFHAASCSRIRMRDQSELKTTAFAAVDMPPRAREPRGKAAASRHRRLSRNGKAGGFTVHENMRPPLSMTLGELLLR